MKISRAQLFVWYILILMILSFLGGLFSNLSINKQDDKNQEVYFVKRVIDGDTILLSTGERVRYIGINAPESVAPNRPVECFGKEASKFNRKLVEGKYVILKKDVSEKDKYGRLLRYVYVDNIFVNLELVKRGYAYAYTVPPDVKYAELFLKAQREAKRKKLGLWGKCKK